MTVPAPIAWSYSSLKTFQQCPKKYFHTKVAKDFKESDTQATLYGKSVHSACEDYVKEGLPLPKQYEYLQSWLDSLKAIPGEKYCEHRMGLREDLSPCEFFAPDVWWRGVADLLIINGDLAHSIDYKTSKSSRYADLVQLDLVATAVFAHFPQVKRVKSGLLFIVTEELIRKEQHAKDMQNLIASSRRDVARIAAAHQNGVWNARSGPLCRFCPVTSCEHHG